MIHRIVFVLLLAFATLTAAAQSPAQKKEMLAAVQQDPASCRLRAAPQRTNSFPTAVALSPDGKYLAILNNGYGSCRVQVSAVDCLAGPDDQSGA